MNDKINGLVAGVLIGATLATSSVLAASGEVQKWLSYNNIKITLNGQTVEPKDADGNYVEPFIIDGTTYLPVRAVASAVGLNVDWDGATNTVKLSDTSGDNQTKGETVYEKGGIKITYNGLSSDDYAKYFKFLVENNTDAKIIVQTRDESINDFMISGIMSQEVQPNKKANTELIYFNESLNENGIGVIESLELSFCIIDSETWDTIDESAPIVIKP